MMDLDRYLEADEAYQALVFCEENGDAGIDLADCK